VLPRVRRLTLSKGGGDRYATSDGVSPPLVADFSRNYFRALGSTVAFSGLITFARASTATYFDADGALQTAASGSPRLASYEWIDGRWVKLGALLESDATVQLLHGTDDLETQDETVTAQAYTLHFRGTGSITLSGAHTAVLSGIGDNDLVSLTFTPEAGTLTVTPSGAVNYPQLEVGNIAKSYVPNTAGSGTATRAAETATITSALLPYNTTGVAIAMSGRVTYADDNIALPSTGEGGQVDFYKWRAGAGTFVSAHMVTNSTKIGEVAFVQRDATSGLDFSRHGNDAAYAPGRDRRFSICGRYSNSLVGGSVSGVAGPPNADPVSFPVLSSTNFQIAPKFNGHVETLLFFGQDIGQDASDDVTRPAALGFPAQVNHIIWYGQSWSLGFDSTPLVTTTQRHHTQMFNGGIRQLESIAENAAALQSLTLAVESEETGTPEFETATVAETGAVAFGHTVWDMIEDIRGAYFASAGHQMLLSAPGEGAKNINLLSGSPYIDRVKEQIDRGYALAQAASKTYAVAAVTWIQMTNASGDETLYPGELEALRLDIDAYAKTVTGQSEHVRLITWQMFPRSSNRNNDISAKAVYDRFVVAADDYPYIICHGPSYQYSSVNPSNAHFRSAEMIEIGRQTAVAYVDAVVLGSAFEPLRPISITREGAVATISMNPIGAVVSDTVQVSTIANYGFTLCESDGTTPISISSAEINGSNQIVLTAAATIPAGALLTYAGVGTDFADANKWRGTIRDSAGNKNRTNRWLVAFELGFDN